MHWSPGRSRGGASLLAAFSLLAPRASGGGEKHTQSVLAPVAATAGYYGWGGF